MRTPLAFSALLAGALLLTACGTQTEGGRPGANSLSDADSSGPCTPPADGTGLRVDGVEITAPDRGVFGCAPATASDTLHVRFQVTNSAARPATYTVQFEVKAASGESLTHPEVTVRNVAPGRTVSSTADITDPGARAASRVRVERVRSVPTDEVPGKGGPCPPSGVRVWADQGDAAMGLRLVGLHLQNCSTRPYRLDGFPEIQLSDEEHKPVTGVSVVNGSGGISTVPGFDGPARATTLQPGQSASSGLMWRNTVTSGDPVNVPYVRVTAKPGAQPVTVTPELDLGTTGKLGVGPWERDTASR